MDMWKKLHLKSDSLVVLSPPSMFGGYLTAIKNTHEVSKSISGPFSNLLAFVSCRDDLPQILVDIRKHAAVDPVIWFAYPKKTSKLSKDLSRDKGFESIGQLGYEPVSNVSIDEDWSALRFRKVDFIKTMTRLACGTISAVGKKRTAENKGPAERAAETNKKARGAAVHEQPAHATTKSRKKDNEKVPPAVTQKKKSRC